MDSWKPAASQRRSARHVAGRRRARRRGGVGSISTTPEAWRATVQRIDRCLGAGHGAGQGLQLDGGLRLVADDRAQSRAGRRPRRTAAPRSWSPVPGPRRRGQRTASARGGRRRTDRPPLPGGPRPRPCATAPGSRPPHPASRSARGDPRARSCAGRRPGARRPTACHRCRSPGRRRPAPSTGSARPCSVRHDGDVGVVVLDADGGKVEVGGQLRGEVLGVQVVGDHLRGHVVERHAGGRWPAGTTGRWPGARGRRCGGWRPRRRRG